MGTIGSIIQAGCVLAAASILGSWFLAELKKLRSRGKPWHAIYFTIPGIIVIGLILLLPLIVRLRLG